MLTGTVKWFNAKKGYGFIVRDDNAAEVFVYFNDIDQEGYKKLNQGQKVTFTLGKNDKGEKAENVKVVA